MTNPWDLLWQLYVAVALSWLAWHFVRVMTEKGKDDAADSDDR